MNVGFVGLGAMGRPMASNILERGFPLVVHDLNDEAVQELHRKGAVPATDLAGVAKASDVVICMLPRPEDVEDVVLGTGGLVNDLHAGSVFVDMGTGDPLTARRLADALGERGIETIDCPVGRTEPHARAGTLLLMAGGREDVLERIRPVLMCMGKELVHCGGAGAGQAMKLVNNMLALTVFSVVGEALTLGARAGLPVDVIRDVTAGTMAQTAVLDIALPAKAFAGDFTPGFAVRLAEKDVGLAVELARQLGVPVPFSERTLQHCAELIAAGRANDDVGALVAAQAEHVGLDLSDTTEVSS